MTKRPSSNKEEVAVNIQAECFTSSTLPSLWLAEMEEREPGISIRIPYSRPSPRRAARDPFENEPVYPLI